MNERLQSLVVLTFALLCGGAVLVFGRADSLPDDPGPLPQESSAAERATTALRHFGWVPARAPAEGVELGVPYSEPPLYPLVAVALVERALPSRGWIMTPPQQRPHPKEIAPARAASLETFTTRGLPRLFAALAAFFGALAGASLVRRLSERHGARGAGVLFGAAVGGASAAAFLVESAVLGSLRPHAVFAAALVACALWTTLRALDPERIQRPFGSALRGGAVGLLLGSAIGAHLPAFLLFVGIQLGLAARLFLRQRSADGALVPARALPVFATSIHKTALLVLLPTTVESPLAPVDPLGAGHLSWLHFGWIAAGWLLFAPFALTPRLVSKRPAAASIPALLLVLALLAGALPGFSTTEFLGDRDLGRVFSDAPFFVLLFGAAGASLLAFAVRRAPAGAVALGVLVAATLVACAQPWGDALFA
ncbi:MAG: hypothetical protein AAFZ87_16465, partial [Planctomycetota bacterium]